MTIDLLKDRIMHFVLVDTFAPLMNKNIRLPIQLFNLGIFIVFVFFTFQESKHFVLSDREFLGHGAMRVILGELSFHDFVTYDAGFTSILFMTLLLLGFATAFLDSIRYIVEDFQLLRNPPNLAYQIYQAKGGAQ